MKSNTRPLGVNTENKLIRVLLWCLWLGLLGVIYWFVLQAFRYSNMTSDNVLHSIELPEEMVNAPGFLLKEFNYHNYDHRVAFIAAAHTVGAFFLPAHAYGTYVTGALILSSSFNAAMIWLLRKLKTNLWVVLLATLLFSLSYSGVVFQHIHGQHSYTLEAISIAAIVVALLSFYKSDISKVNYFALGGIAIIIFLNCIIGVNRTLITIFIPTFSVLFVVMIDQFMKIGPATTGKERLTHRVIVFSKLPHTKFMYFSFAALAGALFLGFVTYKSIISNYSYTIGVSQDIDISNLSSIVPRTQDYLDAILKTLGYGFDQRLFWSSGLSSIGAILLLLSFVIGMLRIIFVERLDSQKIVFLYTVALIGTHFLAFNVTRVTISDRYTLSITLMIFISVITLLRCTRSKFLKIIVLTSLLAYTSSAILFVSNRMQILELRVESYSRLDMFFDEQNVEQGLSIYPVFGPLTLNTDITVRPINIGREGNLQRSTLTHNRWIDIDSNLKQSVFISQTGHGLSKKPALDDLRDFITSNGGTILSTNVIDQYEIWTVDGDVKRFIPYSAFKYGKPYSDIYFPIDDSSSTKVGVVEKLDKPECKYVLSTKKGTKGIALTTFFIELPKGNYDLSLKGTVVNDTPRDKTGMLYVSTKSGKGRFSQDITKSTPLNFSIVDERAMISVKLTVEGEAIDLCGWSLTRKDK